MSFLGRIPSVIDAVGITAIDINKALAESLAVSTGVINKTKEVQQYWIDNAPETDRPEHPIMKGSDITIAPGDYKKSIRIKYGKDPALYGIVYTDAPHAHWLEYGSIHNPEYGYAQKTADHFNGTEFSRSV